MRESPLCVFLAHSGHHFYSFWCRMTSWIIWCYSGCPAAFKIQDRWHRLTERETISKTKMILIHYKGPRRQETVLPQPGHEHKTHNTSGSVLEKQVEFSLILVTELHTLQYDHPADLYRCTGGVSYDTRCPWPGQEKSRAMWLFRIILLMNFN